MPPDMKTNMSYGFNFCSERGLLKVLVYGRANQQNMRSRFALLATDRRWKSEYKLLIDYSGVTVIDRPKALSETIRDLLDEIPLTKLPVGIAYVFPDRLFCQCFDHTLSEHKIEARCQVRFFRHEETAVEWLEKLARP